MIIPKACRAQGCSSINMNGENYCPTHKKSNNKNKVKRVYEHHKIYNTAAWRQLSKNKRRFNPFCEVCGEITDVVDHIVEIVDNDNFSLYEDNLMCMCHACHNEKTKQVKKARDSKDLDKFYTDYLKENNRQFTWYDTI